jgi:hypothetical protein
VTGIPLLYWVTCNLLASAYIPEGGEERPITETNPAVAENQSLVRLPGLGKKLCSYSILSAADSPSQISFQISFGLQLRIISLSRSPTYAYLHSARLAVFIGLHSPSCVDSALFLSPLVMLRLLQTTSASPSACTALHVSIL